MACELNLNKGVLKSTELKQTNEKLRGVPGTERGGMWGWLLLYFLIISQGYFLSWFSPPWAPGIRHHTLPSILHMAVRQSFPQLYWSALQLISLPWSPQCLDIKSMLLMTAFQSLGVWPPLSSLCWSHYPLNSLYFFKFFKCIMVSCLLAFAHAVPSARSTLDPFPKPPAACVSSVTVLLMLP